MNLEKQAIDILQTFAGDDPYQLGYSGGKDSDVILHLAKKAGVAFRAVHDLTTVDAPETIYYIRSKKEVKINYPETSMWELIVKKKTPPTRLLRYCCVAFKEQSGKGKKVITGVRKVESRSRKENQGVVTFTKPDKQMLRNVDDENFAINNNGGIMVLNYENSETHRMVENCYRTSKTLVNPIIDWDDEFLWWYIRRECIQINPGYNNGMPGGRKRIGCIGCPMSGKGRWKDFELHPEYKWAYIRAFARMLEYRRRCGNKEVARWNNAQGVFDWWMEDQNVNGQIEIEFSGTEIEGLKERGGIS